MVVTVFEEEMVEAMHAVSNPQSLAKTQAATVEIDQSEMLKC